MFRKVSPDEQLELDGRAMCKNFTVSDTCQQCAMHGSYKFCEKFITTGTSFPEGGLFNV